MALTLNNFVGFETGGLEEAIATAGTPILQEVVVHAGDFALEGDAVADQYDIRIISGVSYDAGNRYIVGFPYRVTTIAGSDIFVTAFDSLGDIWELQRIGTALRLLDAAGAQIGVDAPGVFTPNAWHFVEVAYEHSAAGAIDVHVDSVSKVSSVGEDLTDGGVMDDDAAVYRLLGAQNGTAYFDDVYCYSGGSDPADFLGNTEVFRYQANTNSATPDYPGLPRDLDTGVWQNLGTTPGDANEASYDGGTNGESIFTDDVPSGKHYRHGPHGDSNIDGTIKGGKWIFQLMRGAGPATTFYTHHGCDSGNPAAIVVGAVTLTTSYLNYDRVVVGPYVTVPTIADHFAIGFGRGAAGGREVFCKGLWAMLLHVPPPAPPAPPLPPQIFEPGEQGVLIQVEPGRTVGY